MKTLCVATNKTTILFGAQKAVTGEWSVDGKVKRLTVFRRKYSEHLKAIYLVIGAYIFSVGIKTTPKEP